MTFRKMKSSKEKESIKKNVILRRIETKKEIIIMFVIIIQSFYILQKFEIKTW